MQVIKLSTLRRIRDLLREFLHFNEVTLTSTVTSSKVRRSVLLLLPFLTDGPVPVAGPVW